MEKIVISGVTSGFGIEWLYELDKDKQAEFFILARNKAKFDAIVAARPLKNTAHFINCDFSALKSIESAAEKVSALTDSVDILINNAGVWSGDNIELSQDNIEMTFAVNQLAPYLLTGNLLPLLHRGKKSAIINTASFRHSDAKINRNDIEVKSDYNSELAYCNSKLYSILFTKQLAGLLKDTSISVNCFDPGIVDTPMLKQGFPKKLNFLYPFVRRFIARTPKKGAETGVYLANNTAGDNVSGQYFKDKKIKKVSSLASDPSLAKWLWSESERLSGYSYPSLAD
ncbi:NAD(P)-dependent dehydrogenase (short-subunit alcohol dehydrogenase family) [Sinobacterium caligoides]|uniref:NAD(P)-dependent dehydrogenase (Short-subunit alcohol dehydrogenase family) n=1 Tax=Sinobacterium caligoides TaxID=933926 RepID=A0A3N2DHB8_9GAMM|nr:SDR family NAD(P)-dependent oxidoreductase [Sinobacterium caligoides]ROR99008.1 NAD(P)-dependent dehydrogenase (short-subunit alcohol dehydrogenase family) [Sinobacterium caligoides]